MFNIGVFRVLCGYLVLWPSIWGWYYIAVQMQPKGVHHYFAGYSASMIVALLLTLGLLSRDRSQPVSLRFDRAQRIALLLFVISALLGPALAAPHPDYAYLRLTLLLPLVLAGFAAFIWFQTLPSRRIMQVALAFVCGMLLHALLVLPFLQPYIDLADLDWMTGIVPYFNVRRYTNYFAVAIPVMTGLWVWANARQSDHDQASRFISIVAMAGLSACWTLQFWAGSRAPSLAVLCGITAVAILAGQYRKPLIVGSVCAMLIGALTSLLLPRPHPSFGFWARLLDIERYDNLNSLGSGRIAVWQEAWRLFTENPWFGNGHSQFAFQDGLAGQMKLETPHNLPLEMLNDFGVVGGLPILFLVYGGVLHLVWQASKRQISPVTLMCLLALLTMSAQSLFDGNITAFLSVIPFGLFWALAAASLQSDAKKREREAD